MRVPVLALLSLTAIHPAFAQPSGDPSGTWLTESGAKVRVARCGGGYCGTLASTSGSGLDVNNPDPALKSRKLVGVQILTATTPTGDGFGGSLYNPNDGKTYSGSLTPKGAVRLSVSGCVLRVLCKSQTWTRVK
ncbi:DUF2147 domain-containing protein [Methylobacterium sp. C25]|uniref:DUF2147 domain-containing protein n=1 Tax=Methylobacterium sp. C25 TaxID=2721622 RepID=UPI001F1CE4AA|nr:DUF2147 domain-containing protein [Methylobacterium sp. C25]MCE4224167.1 DUF2147 domain-containing protein [Methylobacterium sp. C25]